MHSYPIISLAKGVHAEGAVYLQIELVEIIKTELH